VSGVLFNPEVLMQPARELENVQRLRGWIIDCFARSEYLLTDFGNRCLALPELEGIYTSFPGDFKKKVNRIKAIFQTISPSIVLNFDKILTDLLADYEARNVLCHGFVIGVRGDNSSQCYRFLKWDRDAAGYDQVVMDFTVDQMFAVADRLGSAASQLFEAFRSEYEVRGWNKGSIFDDR